MNPIDEEQFAARLRAMEGEPPAIDVDRVSVLARGRRRRAARTGGVVAGVGILVGAVALGGMTWAGDRLDGSVTSLPGSSVAPTVGADPSETGASGDSQSPDAVIDYETGTITTPAEAYRYSSHEAAIVQTAQDVFQVECLQDAGVEAEWLRPAPGWGERDYIEFGIWRLEDLQEHGYEWVDRTTDPETGDLYRTTRYDREAARAVPCGDRMRAAGLILHTAPSQDEGKWAMPNEEGIRSVEGTEAGHEILAEWARCMERNGVLVDSLDDDGEAPFLPAGVQDMSHEEQIRIGTLDLGCKEDLNTLERVVEVQAQEELAWIERVNSHDDYLDRRHAAEEEILAKAEDFLAERDITVPAD